jgi:hypothetical protein
VKVTTTANQAEDTERLTQRQAEEVADCLRDTYDLPITVTKTITSASK